MTLNISDYIPDYSTSRCSSWDSLRDYVISRIISFSDKEITNIINLTDFEGKPLFKDNEISKIISLRNKGIENKTETELDKIALKYIQRCGCSILSPNEYKSKAYDSFDSKIRNYKNNKNGTNGSFERSTLYPLLFILRIHNVAEILSFCRDILHQQELSAHCMEDFIVMCSLKLKISYLEYSELRECLQEYIDEELIISNKINSHMTGDNLDSLNKIDTIDKLKLYITTNTNRFAIERNTPYNMLFPCVNWVVWEKETWDIFFDIFPEERPTNYDEYTIDNLKNYINDEEGIDANLMKKLVYFSCSNNFPHNSKPLELKNYLPNRFKKYYTEKKYRDDYNFIREYRDHMFQYSSEFSLFDYYMSIFSITDNGLSEDEITLLGKRLYKHTFIPYQTFHNIFLRERSNKKTTADPITQGVYLLSFIHYYPIMDFKYGGEYYIPDIIPLDDIYDLFNTKDSIDNQFNFINTILSLGGFPALNEHDHFNRLFMDTYRQVLEENTSSNLSCKEIKEKFLSRLCSYLKQIANELTKKEQ